MLTTKAIRGAGMNKFSVSPDRGIIGLVYKSHKGITSSYPSNDSRFDPSLDNYRKSSTRNILCVPLKTANNCIGCIEMSNKIHSEYTVEDFNLLSCIAKQLAIGLVIHKHKEVTRVINDQIANNNLLTPLLKNVLIILAEILKSEK
jgi:GAF domain-containing protein